MTSVEKPQIIDDVAIASRAIVWVGSLSDQQKSDVLESTLFCQLAADKQHSPDSEDNTLAWYKKYTDTLESIGWVVGKADFTAVTYEKSEGTMHDRLLQQLATDGTVSKALYADVSRALLAFARTGAGSDAETVFDRSAIASSAEFASFQIAVASADEGGNVMLTLFAWFYSSTEKVENALWFSWKNARLTIKTSKLAMTLNTDVYARVRMTIHDRLKDADKLDLLVPI